MIAVVVGKKGSGKSALLRKLTCRALRAKAAIFYHDPQAQLAEKAGRVYESTAAWAADTHTPFLSIFRGMDAEEVAALALRVGDVTVVLDELDQAFLNKRYRDTRNSAIRKIIHEGRHHRVSLMGGFRRTQNVPEDLTSQVDWVFLFRQNGANPQDLRIIGERFGPAYAEKVARLEFGEFLAWRDDA